MRFAFAPPFMVDSSGSEAGVSHAVTLTLAQSATGLTVTLAADPTWLADPARRWPVVIDSTVTLNGSQNCYIVNANYASSNFCTVANTNVGYDGPNIRRTLLQFDVQSALPANVTVLNAELGLYLYDESMTNVTPVGVHQLTHSWTTGVTWNAYNGTNAWTTAGGDFIATPAYTNNAVGGTLGWYYWYPTRLVQGWVDGTIANNRLLFKAGTEQVNNILRFVSTRGTTTADWPYLTVEYEPWLGERDFYKLDSHQLTDRMQAQVNVANGNLVLHAQDLHIRGTGLDLRVDRYYNSQLCLNWDFGNGWTMGTGFDVGLWPYNDGSVAFYGPSGYWIPFLKNSDGSFTSPSGIDATLVKNADGSYTLTFHKSGEKYTFDSNGWFLSDVDKNGNKLTFGYNADGTLASITDTQGRVSTFTYNAAAKLTKMTDPAGRTYQYAYDANNNLTSYTDPAGKLTQFAYVNHPSGCGADLVQITDPNGNVTKFAYDSSDRVTSLTRITNPATGAGATTSYTYNAGNTVLTDPNGHTTTYYYDYLGRVTKVVDANGKNTTSSYTADSNVQQATDAAGQITAMTYDGNDNLVSAQSTTGTTSRWQYQDSAHAYDPSSATDPQGNTLSYAYDPNGNRTSTTNGLVSQNQYKYAYNSNGTLASTTDPRGNVTSFGYDAKGNLTSMTPPAPLGATTMTYDALSHLSTLTDGKGQKTTYTYDALDRVTQIAYADNSGITYSFDADGNLLNMVDNTGTTSFTYDALNSAARSSKTVMERDSTLC